MAYSHLLKGASSPSQQIMYRPTHAQWGTYMKENFEWFVLACPASPKLASYLTPRKQLSVCMSVCPYVCLSVCMCVTFSNQPPTPNHLSYRNGTDLFEIISMSQFQWCPLCWGQTPEKLRKTAKNAEKCRKTSFFLFVTFILIRTNPDLRPNRITFFHYFFRLSGSSVIRP